MVGVVVLQVLLSAAPSPGSSAGRNRPAAPQCSSQASVAAVLPELWALST